MGPSGGRAFEQPSQQQHDIDRSVNRMSVHPGEFSEAAHSIPQDWASLAHYLARRGIVFGPSQPRQFAGGYGNLNYLIEIDGMPAVLRRPPAGPLPYGGTIWRANTHPLLAMAGVSASPAGYVLLRRGRRARRGVPDHRVPSWGGFPRHSSPGLGWPARGRHAAEPTIGREPCRSACSSTRRKLVWRPLDVRRVPRANRRGLGSSQRSRRRSDQSWRVIRGG